MGACSSKKVITASCRRDSTVTNCSSSSPASSTGSSVASGITRVISSIDNVGRLREFYSVENTSLGVGAFSTVCKGRNRSTKMECAIKTISKSKVKAMKGDHFERIKQEIALLRLLKHKHIVTLLDTFEDDRTIRLVMELCDGGKLSERLIDAGRFTEGLAGYLMRQIFEAVCFMHANEVCHRDLNPENVLFESRAPIESSSLKIVDFGSACRFQKGQPMHTKVGASCYVAPQVLCGKYDHSSDLWSCGVIMHVLLCGYPPFTGETEEDVLVKVRRGSFTFNAKDWKMVSEDAQRLVGMLIKKNPQDRYTAEQALSDSWIEHVAQKPQNGTLLCHCQPEQKIKKAPLNDIAEQLTEEQIIGLSEIFRCLDNDGNGKLDATQLRTGLTLGGVTEKCGGIDEAIKEFNLPTHDGRAIDYEQFVEALSSRRSRSLAASI